jgi:hypothetical protein
LPVPRSKSFFQCLVGLPLALYPVDIWLHPIFSHLSSSILWTWSFYYFPYIGISS